MGIVMDMASGKQKAAGEFARAVSAEIRAVMARQRVSGAKLAEAAGMSQGYLSKRLRDQAPFTLNDVEAISKALGEDLLRLSPPE